MTRRRNSGRGARRGPGEGGAGRRAGGSPPGEPPGTTAAGRAPVPDAAAILGAFREPEFETAFVPEPLLLFGRNQELVDPRVGLGVYGPFDVGQPVQRHIRVGVIGTGPLIDRTRAWLDQCAGRVLPVRRTRERGELKVKRMDPRVVPTFPGIGEVFEADFTIPAGLTVALTPAELADVDREGSYFEQRVTRLIDLLVGKLRVLSEKSAPPHVVVIALPTAVRARCTAPTKHRRRPKHLRRQAEALKADLERDAAVGQTALFDLPEALGVNLEEALADEQTIFHDGLKARAMAAVDFPTQLLWEGTLDGVGVEDDATRAWNFWTGLYYKAGNEPWRIARLAPGSCFVGLGFYRERRDATLRACLAQTFSDAGEGIVLRSEAFKWEGSRTPHLPRELARAFMEQVLAAYKAHWDQHPRRVVIHKRQRYTPDERAGFEEAFAAAGVHTHDLVAFGDRGLRFFRTGKEPPLRGTLVTLGPGNALLYTRGYVPFHGEYTGMRVPRPLEIVEHLGAAPLRQVAEEILALTKMDWNSTTFAGREPITTAFAEDVGHILAEVAPGLTDPKRLYRFYM